MRVFVIAAMGAAVLAGCAPFQHGHYSEDVSYLNSKGDPPGTPLVYQEGPVQSAQIPQRTFAAAPTTSSIWPQQTTSVAGSAFGAGGFPTLSPSQQTVSYSQPVNFPASAPSYSVQQVAVPAPALSNPVSYAPTLQQTYVPPVQTTLAPTVQSFAPPVRQAIVRPAVTQVLAPPPARQLLTRASYVAPTQPSSTVLATSYGGHQIDADGYAICNVPWPDHAAHQTPKFKPSHQAASHVVRSAPRGPLRF